MLCTVILSFSGTSAEDIFHGDETKAARALPKDLWPIARRKLDMIDAASNVNDLRQPPGNRFEKLVGDRAGQYSIRINDQFRICFEFDKRNATNVEIVDYH